MVHSNKLFVVLYYVTLLKIVSAPAAHKSGMYAHLTNEQKNDLVALKNYTKLVTATDNSKLSLRESYMRAFDLASAI